MDSINWVVFVIFIGLLLSIGLWRKAASEDHYLLANRKTSFFPLVATLVMTEFNTATLLSFSAAGYTASWWALSLSLVFLIGLLFYGATVAKHWKRFNGVSVAHYFTLRYDQKIGYFVAVVLFFAMAGFSAVYIQSLTLLFSSLFPLLPSWLLSAMIVSLVLLMTLRGGLVSIIRTDVFAFCLLIILFPLLVYFANQLPVAKMTKTPNFLMMQQELPIKFVLSLIFLTMFSYILAPWYGQKIVSAKSTKVAFLSVVCAAIIVAVLYGVGIAAVAILRSKGIVLPNPELAIPYLINRGVPPYLRGIAFAFLFYIGATTLAGVWSAMVTLVIGEMRTTQQLWRSYFLTIFCALLAYMGANQFSGSILNQMILANIPIVALSFALLAGFYWKKASRTGVYFSVIAGIVWGLFCYFYYGQASLYTWYWAVYGIPFIFILGCVGSWLESSKRTAVPYLKTTPHPE